MVGFGNGEVPSSHLVEVEVGLFLEAATAAAYRKMKAAAAREGVQLAIPRPAGAYRSLFVQQDMHDRPWLYNLDPTSSVALAPPGSSTHGLGTRVDIVRGAAGDWAIRNASRFGFVREFGASDPRHFRYSAPSWASATQPVPTQPIFQEGDDMARIIHDKDKGGYWLVTAVDYLELSSSVAIDLYPTFGDAILVTHRQRVQTLAVIDTIRSNRRKEFASADGSVADLVTKLDSIFK